LVLLNLSHLQKPPSQALDELMNWYTEFVFPVGPGSGSDRSGFPWQNKIEELISNPYNSLENLYAILGHPGLKKFRMRVKYLFRSTEEL